MKNKNYTKTYRYAINLYIKKEITVNWVCGEHRQSPGQSPAGPAKTSFDAF